MKTKKRRTKYITRRVIENRKYNIYEVKNNEMIYLDTITLVGRVKLNDLAKLYNVDQVVAVEIECCKKIYGVPIEDFMKIAVDITNLDIPEED